MRYQSIINGSPSPLTHKSVAGAYYETVLYDDADATIVVVEGYLTRPLDNAELIELSNIISLPRPLVSRRREAGSGGAGQ